MGITNTDRVGLGWRAEIAAGIFASLDEIEIVEVIAEDYFGASRPRLDALRTLAAQRPITLHGVSAGIASTVRVAQPRFDAMARLVDALRPESWSEHLAFVRGAGREIGHLAAPPRTRTSVAGAAENLDQAVRTVGLVPMMENVATLIDPPCSTMNEPEWLGEVAKVSGCRLLLDLHNLYANCANFGGSAVEMLATLPLDRVEVIHIAGGVWIQDYRSGKRRLLDDHLHAVPDAVFSLLAEVAARAPQPLTVILERDGEYPAMEELLFELRVARRALARGRAVLRSQEEGHVLSIA